MTVIDAMYSGVFGPSKAEDWTQSDLYTFETAKLQELCNLDLLA